MDLQKFVTTFERYFPKKEIDKVSSHFEDKFTRSFFDPCFLVEGFSSLKKQMLLKLAFSCLDAEECYLEVGTYTGKSLISALMGNEKRKCYACDNFTEFTDSNSFDILMANLERYELKEEVTFFNTDFRHILSQEHIQRPVGLYFYDGAHDFASQYDAIKKAEHLLAPDALVIVDDWRFAKDSRSYAKEATEKAIRESSRKFEMLYELPARFNGDHAMWWNGIAVYSSKADGKY